MQKDDFEQIDINQFFDSQNTFSVQEEKAEMLTKKQKELISQAMPIIREIDSEKADNFQERNRPP